MRALALFLALVFLSLDAPVAAQGSPYALVLRFTIATGDDDLRGGNDNVYAVIDVAGTTTRHLLNQRSTRWADGSRHVTDVPLPSGFRTADLRSIQLETTFGGGIGGDNWNMASAVVDIRPRYAEGMPLVVARQSAFRFTGDRRRLSLTIRPELPRESSRAK
jgi:hypothetical protein